MINTGYECSLQLTCAEMLRRAGKVNGEKWDSIDTSLGGKKNQRETGRLGKCYSTVCKTPREGCVGEKGKCKLPKPG